MGRDDIIPDRSAGGPAGTAGARFDLLRGVLATLAATVDPVLDPVTARIKPAGTLFVAAGFCPIGPAVEPVVDTLALRVQPLVAAFAAAIQALIDAVASPVEPLVDPVAPVVEPLVDAVAAILGQCRGREGRQDGRSDQHLQGLAVHF